MNVTTIEISRAEALRKLEQYQRIQEKLRTKEDEKLQSLYAAVSKGARVIDVRNAFRETGLNEKGEPKLAIAQADWKKVYFHPKCCIEWTSETRYIAEWWETGAGTFSMRPEFSEQAYKSQISFTKTFPDNLKTNIIFSPVPHVPPNLRPKLHLRNYHILFEVQEWETYPVDPFLLRRIYGNLFVVEAEWELTPLEAMLLSSMQTGN